ncbi:MAG: glycolate oxidase subunit GlcE [Betaproteobacteria bacterium]|nr:glycolate oxidase subunit GlcE [Betaproteobacteria bacterium]MDH5349609.1 glycolate oxidase subunit GlcE [Betaproteobacteria bacterium]
MLERLRERIRDAAGRRAALRLRGGGSKDFYGGEPRGEILDTRVHAGIVEYEATELVVTARCGTPLAELEAALAEKGQMLPFEPPRFGADATLGGCVAAGLSGPRRAAAGAVRDFVLGARLLDGRADELAFGGRVMKNVAGYDVARLLAGSLGTLGLILEVSLKVLPRPPAEATLRLELPQDKALEALNRWAGQPLPVTASAWRDGELHLRLSGAERAVRAAAQHLGGHTLAPGDAGRFWESIREHTHPFFAGAAPLWRLSLPAPAAPLALAGAPLIEWGGALRWLRTEADAAAVRAAAASAGGHATLFRGGDKSAGVFAPLAMGAKRLHRELKAAFDPAGVFNPGRLYPDL